MNRSARVVVGLLVLACASIAVSTSAQVVINEIHYNPPDPNMEFLELHNAGAAAVDVGNWSIADAIALNLPPGTSIPGHGYLVVALNPASVPGALAWTSGNLSNGGEIITLRDASLATVDVVNYDDAAPWPTSPDGTGPSLELINPALDNNSGSSWLPSAGTNGTPGAQNSVFSNAATVESEVPARRTAVASLPSVSVTFSESVTGVTAGALTVGGSPATAVSGSGAGPYVFSGYAAPSAGSVTIALSAIGTFGGDSWTVSVGIVVVLNELHYHPFDVDADAEFLELYNAGGQAVNVSGWAFTSGIVGAAPPGTTIPADGYLVFAKVPSLVQARTGYAGALAWSSGSLSNGGETVTISDAAGNVIDSVTYGDAGAWPKAADGDGPSLELVNPGLPNEYGGAWRASPADWGTPGAQNGSFLPAPPPIITETLHVPLIPLPNQSITVTALVLDDQPTPPAVTLYYRQDFDPTIAYTATPMLDDGLHGDGAAGDNRYGAIVPGLPDGQRLDFTIRADDGTSVSPAPPGHDTLNAGEFPAQTYLCKFSSGPLTIDFPHYHLITTQHTRNLQSSHDENEYDATFLQCEPPLNTCRLFYNVVERYRGQSSLNQHPHSYRVNFPASDALPSELGFDLQKLNLHAQQPDRQYLGYQFFREAFGGSIPSSRAQFVRLDTNPLSHGGIDDYAYVNVEKEDEDFLDSQGGAVTPTRFPGACTGSLAACSTDAQCGPGETCFDRSAGNIYQGVLTGDLQYLGTNPDSYRPSYEKESNETDDVWTDLMDLTQVLDPDTTPDASYEASLNAVADEDEWARFFAVHMLAVNQEGGIYRDTGDDFYVYLEPPDSPLGYNTVFIPRDLDSMWGGFGVFNQETIWRTNVQTVQRFLRNNAYAGRFVGAICELLDTDFTQAAMDARIDALPDVVADTTKKNQFKAWVAGRIAFVNGEIVRQTTLTGVPASPYQAASPTINLSGQLNQCGTYRVLVNGSPATSYSIYNHTWSAPYTLVPGPNQIVVQAVDVNGVVLDQASADVVYAPPGVAQSSLRLTMPSRMLNPYTLSLKAELLDSLGGIDWRTCDQLGTVSATRVSDNSAVPITVTVFDPHLAVPAGSIRFYNGIGSVSFTLDNGAAEPAGDIRVTVTLGSLTATKIVTIVSDPTFRSMSGTLAGANLTWGPNETIRITGATTVPSGSVLTVNPGTLVLVNTTGGLENGTLITVNGSISAVGSSDDPIHFFSERNQLAMALTQSGSASNGDAWRGFELRGSGSSTFKWVFLTGAGNGVVTGHPRPPIIHLFDTHNLLAEDGSFLDNNGMIFSAAGTGNYTVRRSLISRCGIGAEFNGNGHTLLIEDSWWTSCGWAPEPLTLDGDLLHIDGSASNQTIRRSIFADSGDDGIDHSGSNFTVESIIIRGILDKAISMTGGSVEMHNSLIFGSGSAIRGLGRVYNSTISGGNVLTPQIIQESILWTGSNDSCAGDIDYNILGNPAHTTCGVGNISVNPQFQGSCNFNPQAGSPALTAGPTGGRIGWLGFPTATTCLVDSECNDGNACSLDTCELGVCTFTPIVGCTSCTTAADCSDGDACTTDTCGSLGTCQSHQPVSCDDGNACTTDTCNPASGCQHSAATCDDGNPCTDDACVAGGCQHTSNAAPCSDGSLCTTGDICGGGACTGSPVVCPGGSVCEPSTGACVAGPQTLTFRDGVSSYAGTQDTYLAQAAPTTVEGALDTWRWDTENPAPNQEFGLIRFDGIFGNGADQIPPGSTIQSATLTLVVFNASVNPAGTINESAVDWAEATATYDNFGGDTGVQTDEYRASPVLPGAPIASGSQAIDVMASLAGWSGDPALNFGWLFRPNSNDGVQVRSSEYATIAERPLLSVTFQPPVTGCSTDAQCTDGDVCNGLETCVGGTCQAGTPLSCDDGNVCTDDSCDPVGGCQHVNNTAPCDDADACTAGDTCAGGFCVAGPAPNCDDGNACTDDSCDPGSGCVHANNSASCGDGLFCNGDEVCAGGSCQPGTPVDCSDGLDCSADSCNEALDTCEHAPCAMTVAAAGSRWLAVTPPPGLASVALRVSAAGLACLPQYIDGTGALTASPVFQSSAQWGTVLVGGRPVVPATAYTVQAEVTAGVPIGSGGATTAAWGDTNASGDVDLFDLVCVLDGTLGTFSACTREADDQNAGDVAFPATIDTDDVLAVLDAFSGTAYPDATPCSGSFSSGSEPR